MDYRDTLRAWVGAVDVPADPVAWAALGLALLGLVLAAGRATAGQAAQGWATRHWRVASVALAALAALLSAGYVLWYLRGGPRIIDATSYFLEARALARGLAAFPVVEPSASFRGRFLLSAPGTHELGVIFPPGYPALLALGMLLGVPMLMGPLIAAGLVLTTYGLGRELTGQREAGLLAAAFSTICVALRYHTADTMAHGWAALLISFALWSSLRGSAWSAPTAGLAAGWLCATRPVSGVVVVMVLGILWWHRGCLRRFLPALLPGLGLLVLHQHATTGTWFSSSQLAYYALADGPPGCFHYGFGRGTGCMNEHGDFVAALLPDGFGARAAAAVTWRRAYSHLRDAFNGQLWGLILLPWILIAGWRRRRLWPPLIIVLGVVLAYVPFYFDGSYPGGGARLYADVLPLEHVLGAAVLWQGSLARWVLPAMLAGFALQTNADHRALRAREGGRPMFEPKVLSDAGVRSGLLFVDTDHGFNLAHRPGELDARLGLVVARERGDAYDAALWDLLGRPPAFRYRYDPGASESVPRVLPYRPSWTPAARFEAESSWPPLGVSGGWVRLEYLATRCASRGRGLGLVPTSAQGITIVVDLTAPVGGRYDVVLGWADSRATELRAELEGVIWRATEQRQAAGPSCWQMPAWAVELSRGTHLLTLHADTGRAILDYVDIRPANPSPGVTGFPTG